MCKKVACIQGNIYKNMHHNIHVTYVTGNMIFKEFFLFTNYYERKIKNNFGNNFFFQFIFCKSLFGIKLQSWFGEYF